MAQGTLIYTQHTVAFPAIPVSHVDQSRYDSVGISDDALGGGTYGEFDFEFVQFGPTHRAVQLRIFGDGLDTFYDRTVQGVIKKWKAMENPDDMTPEQLIDLLERAGVVPSSYHKSGVRSRKESR